MENTVETNIMQEHALDDAAIMTPDVATENESQQSLAEALNDEAQSSLGQPESAPAKSEPGWIRRRVDEGVRKGLAAAEERIRTELRAEYEAQLTPLREMALDRQADQLVAEGKIVDKATALEYLRLKSGQPVSQDTKSTPRDAQGRFTRSQPEVSLDVETQGRILWTEARTIKNITGVDVMSIYNNDPEAQSKILSGEWTFEDVYNAHKNAAQAPRRSHPPTVRSNGYRLGAVNIADMSDAQFERMDRMIATGANIFAGDE